MKVAWRHTIRGVFAGGFMEVAGGNLLFLHSVEGEFVVTALGPDGKVRWSAPFEDADSFFVQGDRCFLGGSRARCVAASTGKLIAERARRERVRPFPPLS